VAQLVYIAALFQISDGCQAAVAGIFRGMGRQKTVACLNFVGFWVIGISCGAALAFETDAGVAGLWWGLAIGLTCTAVLGVLLLLRVDWRQQVVLAQQRVRARPEEEAKAADNEAHARTRARAHACSPESETALYMTALKPDGTRVYLPQAQGPMPLSLHPAPFPPVLHIHPHPSPYLSHATLNRAL
jgi:hypothetical protein